MVPAASAAPSVDKAIVFSDVPEGMMYHREMSWLANENISTGWPDGTFRPLQAINRDAMAAFLYRLAGEPTYAPPAKSPFKDLSTTQQFYKEMTWLHKEGISTGWTEPDGSRTYRALQPINRDAMAAFLYRYAGSPNVNLPGGSPFTDITSSTQYYREMVWLQQSGITTGWPDGTYRPLQPINRDAMAAYLYRYSLPDAVSGVILAPEAIILKDGVGVQKVDPAKATVTLSPAAGPVPDVDAGDVLVAGISPATPDGLLVRVDIVATAADGTQVLTTKPATLTDAIFATDGAVTSSGTVVEQEFVPADGVAVIDLPVTGAGTGPLGIPQDRDGIAPGLDKRSGLPSGPDAGTTLYKKKFTYAEQLKKSTSGTAWKHVDVQGTGTLSLTAEFAIDSGVKATVDVGWTSLKEAKFTLDTSLTAESTVTAAGELKGSAQRSLGMVNTWANIQVGPVPVAVQFISSVDMNVASQWNAEASATAKASTSTSVGMAWKDGQFKKISEVDGDGMATLKGPTLTSSSSVAVGPTLSAKLYGMVGISAGFDVYANYATATGTCALDVGLDGRVALVAGIEVFGFKLTDDWEKEFKKSVNLWHGDACDGVQPPVDDVSKDVFGPGIALLGDGGLGDAAQWGQVPDYGPGGPAWILSTGRMQDSVGSPDNLASTSLGGAGSESLSQFIGGSPTYDAAEYWAKVVPTGHTLHVRFFFASEEYPEYVDSPFNDVMGVFVNGTNCALVPGTSLPVAVNNVNDHFNSKYYIDNSAGASGYSTAMDGLTVPITCSVPVTPGTPLTVRIAVADTSDGVLDSAVALLNGGIWSD
ncbi:S-layer homology domain-containing protein [Paeniglutamicibacter antarcticus]|uniref:S-layer homology domain-containing protein n=1 Tax=Arthrobacter terrae TaxID=2935737 RepID=A0A931CK80_9MICC|nr:choice-of-anchor L domain-containing protein [Arthrobacter terrae]MBG0738000.1 S-layer homology domain-containing protein [Arthrobacter terrae]